MCKASKYLSELDNLVNNINKDFELLSKKQSEYDSMLSDIYHKIENANFNACEGYYLTKQLQELLRKRRVVKDEFSRLNTLRQLLGNSLHRQINNSKQSIGKAKKKSQTWQQEWKYTYTLEEALH
jgi:predicted RND superfamily exporter protein